MNYLVLGGNGFIGSHLVKALQHCGNVRVFDHTINKDFLENHRIDCVEGDFSNYRFHNLLDNIDVVYHLISTTIPCNGTENLKEEIHQNVMPTIRFLDTMIEKDVNKIIFSSSGGTIYGDVRGELTEKLPLNPICSYGVQKLTIEKALDLYRRYHGLNAISVRISNPYGSGQYTGRKQGVVSFFANLIKKGLPIEVWGDGSNVRDYIHIDDVIDALRVIEKYNGLETVFNIASGERFSINQIIEKICIKLEVDVGIIFKEKRYCDVQENCLSAKLLYNECGWKPKINFEEGLTRLTNSELMF